MSTFESASIALTRLLAVELERRGAARTVAREVAELDDVAFQRLLSVAGLADATSGIDVDAEISLTHMLRHVRGLTKDAAK